MSYKQREIPDKPDPAPVGVLSQSSPLLVERELHEAVKGNLPSKSVAYFTQR
jgi:hypothetical protein